MRVTFRAKLMGLVGIAALALLLLVVASAVITRREERQLSTIQERYVPKLELRPQLEGQLERIARSFQDAVAAHDLDALATTSQMKDGFLDRLAAAHDALDPSEAAALRGALEDYCAAAADVSRRLIANETGEELVAAMTDMQGKHKRVDEVLKTTTQLDRNDLGDAFMAAGGALRAGSRLRLAISLASLVAMLVLSLWLSRSLVRSVAELTAGLGRFGRGQFDHPIPIRSRDELGDVSEGANRMAESLQRAQALLLRARERLESEVEERTLQLTKANAAIQQLNQNLEQIVEARTAQLAVANRELEAFSYSVAHDLRAPLRGVTGFAEILLSDYRDKLDAEGRDCLDEILASAREMAELIDALLSLSRVTRAELRSEPVDLSALVRVVVKDLAAKQPRPCYELVVRDSVRAQMDPNLARAVLENLLGNAWKFTSKRPTPRIEFGLTAVEGDDAFFVRDNGAGFDAAYADKLFAPFQRLHTVAEFPGTGVGLATVQRIVHRHGGRIWAEGRIDEGATFYFTLGDRPTGDTI